MPPEPPPPPPPPYDARIEYLESSGSQRIDSGVISATPMECRASVMLFDESSDVTIIGSRDPDRFYLLHEYSGWCFGMWEYHTTYEDFEINKRFEIYSVLHSGDQKFSVDGQIVMTADDTPDLVNNTTVQLFTNARVRLYHVVLLRNGVKLRDYLPVRVGEVGYMYDQVSGELFGNAGSGSFIIGPDID